MPEFIVPQLEHQLKVVGPLTLKQFIFVGGAGAICFFLYFTIPFFFFLLASLPIILVSIVLAFAKAGGRNLVDVFKNFLFFLFAPKLYLWQKKAGPPPKLAEKPMSSKKSKLKELSMQVETKNKE